MTPYEDQQPISGQRPPEIDQLIERLERFRPHPGPGLQTRMAAAPWATGLKPGLREQPPGFRLYGFYAMAMALLFLFLTLALISTPAGRAAAAQLARFFQRSESDFTRITLHLPLAQGSQDSFPLSLAEAGTLAGYPVWRPASMPAHLMFNGARYNPSLNTVIQDYSSQNRLEVLRISQNRLGDQDQYTRIGESAQVELVSLGEVTAEYVSGSWILKELPLLAARGPSAEIEVTATWDPAAQVQLIRWQQDGFLFEILYVNGNPPNPGKMTKSMLADLARGMRP